KARCVLAEIRWRWTLKILWGAARTKVLVAWQQSTERSMSQANNLRRCHTTFDQDTSLIAVVEMSQSSWLVAGRTRPAEEPGGRWRNRSLSLLRPGMNIHDRHFSFPDTFPDITLENSQ